MENVLAVFPSCSDVHLMHQGCWNRVCSYIHKDELGIIKHAIEKGQKDMPSHARKMHAKVPRGLDIRTTPLPTLTSPSPVEYQSNALSSPIPAFMIYHPSPSL